MINEERCFFILNLPFDMTLEVAELIEGVPSMYAWHLKLTIFSYGIV